MFTTYQSEAINFKDLPIELWEIKRFESETISFEQLQKASAKESIKVISGKNEIVENVCKEVRVFTEQDHLQKINFKTRELYEQVKERIIGLDDNIIIQPKKQTIGFRIDNNIFCDIVLQKRT